MNIQKNTDLEEEIALLKQRIEKLENTGVQGPKGEPGERGLKGEQGSQGNKGGYGSQGKPGSQAYYYPQV